VFGTFGIVIPSPGGMGTYHVLATAALVIHGVNSNDAFSFANIVFFSIQIFYNIVIGILSIILLRYMNKKSPPLSMEPILEVEKMGVA
jgi:glycosyltransferase 2 family protein